MAVRCGNEESSWRSTRRSCRVSEVMYDKAKVIDPHRYKSLAGYFFYCLFLLSIFVACDISHQDFLSSNGLRASQVLALYVDCRRLSES